MTRAIKFRAWDRIYKTMIYNFIVNLRMGLTLDGKVIAFDDEVFEDPEHETEVHYYPDRFEFMQFTGLWDSTKWEELTNTEQQAWLNTTYQKDGKEYNHTQEDWHGREIYEGDYLRCKQYIGGNFVEYCYESGYVEFVHGAFGLHRKQGFYRPFKDWLEDYELKVIGSIHDNPDLMEAPK